MPQGEFIYEEGLSTLSSFHGPNSELDISLPASEYAPDIVHYCSLDLLNTII